MYAKFVISHDALRDLTDIIARRRQSLFGHIVQLDGVPAHDALKLQVVLATGRPAGRDWKRRPDRPRNGWIDQLRMQRGRGRAMLRTSLAMR